MPATKDKIYFKIYFSIDNVIERQQRSERRRATTTRTSSYPRHTRIIVFQMDAKANRVSDKLGIIGSRDRLSDAFVAIYFYHRVSRIQFSFLRHYTRFRIYGI